MELNIHDASTIQVQGILATTKCNNRHKASKNSKGENCDPHLGRQKSKLIKNSWWHPLGNTKIHQQSQLNLRWYFVNLNAFTGPNHDFSRKIINLFNNFTTYLMQKVQVSNAIYLSFEISQESECRIRTYTYSFERLPLL